MPLSPVPADQFGRLLTDLRSSIEKAYAAFGLSDQAPQTRITTGLVPSWDCPDTLWIVLRGAQSSQARGLTDQAAGCSILAEAIITLELARCWPNPENIAGGLELVPAAEEATTMQLAQDATVLWYGLGERWQDGELFESFPGLNCEAVRLGQLQPVGPAGGYAGWSWQLRVSMFGTPEEE